MLPSNNTQQPGRARPILPKPKQHPKSPHQDSESDGLTTQKGRPQKRVTVTQVACQSCQQRKSKCDGKRPTCTACANKGRTNCQYDVAGDQRRTTALKQRIDELKTETANLKDIITAICTSADRDALIQIVQTLPASDFRHSAEVAELCRQNSQNANAQTGFPSSASSQPYPPPLSNGPSYASGPYGNRRDQTSQALEGWNDGMEQDGVEDGADMDEDDESKWGHRDNRYPPNMGWR
ncbi:hypothetical protein EJ08DRAFT_662412 [Tothia fuscella]|uniref:Zn(2)-C6 fungal-type domain-containing protein n=1 Tax=Tothia fuscella TaxID=1048955 RepID=A0A9P4NNN0_9PEZI|nr:hypothetical protein EJ08DRAFT_662412 [Tothia fuscella]